MASSACVAPSDYGELFLEYGEDIKRMVWRHLGPSAHREDVDNGVSYIFQQFMKNSALAQYRPDFINSYNHKPTSFRAFILAKVPLYCRGLRETLLRHQGRELLLLDAPAGDDEKLPLADRLVSTADEYPCLAGEGMDRLREALADREGTPGRAPVLPLFDALAARQAEGKRATPASVRRQFGLDKEGMDIWFAELQDALREVTGRRPRVPEPATVPEVPAAEPETGAWFTELDATVSGSFALGGLVLSAGEARAAAAALRAAPGNQVLSVFKRAGHRLAQSGKTWYLGFAEEVMQAHPELRTPKGRHCDGHFGRVKQALIFGLEELAAGFPEDAPEAVTVPVGEPVSEAVTEPDRALWADLEAAMTRMPGFTGETVEAALEAVRLLSLTPA